VTYSGFKSGVRAADSTTTVMAALLEGLLNVGIGVLMFLIATGKVSASKNPASNEVWRAKWGRLLKVCALVVAAWGALTIVQQLL